MKRRRFERRPTYRSVERLEDRLLLTTTQEIEPNNLLASATAVDLNTSVAGQISTASDVDYYSFTLADSERVTAKVTADSGSQLDARITLYNADGTALQTNDDQSSGNVNPQLTQHLLAGTYYLKVDVSGGLASALATGNYHLTTVAVAASSPFGTHPTGAFPRGIAVGDFDGDHIADLLSTDSNAGTVSVQLGLGDLSYQPAITTSVGNSGVGNVAVATGDFDADGNLDVAVANALDNNVTILLGNGDGTFQTPTPDYTINVGTQPSAIVAADFNGDGITDLAVTNYGDGVSDGSVTLLIGQKDIHGIANGKFVSAGDFEVGVGPLDLVVGDFGGNHRNDLAVANSQSDNVTILLNDGSAAGGFVAQSPIAVGSHPTSLTTADFNGDHIADLAVSNAGGDLGTTTVSLLLGSGGGQFQNEVRIDQLALPLLQISGTLGNDYTSSIAAADFNGDGRMDLVVTRSADFHVEVALGNGDGTFAASKQSYIDKSSTPWDIAVGDFNGDGRTDFATTDGFSDFVSYHISVFGGLGDGTFLAASGLNTGSQPTPLAVADLNHDGLPDLVSGNTNDATVFLGQGNGSFNSPLSANSPSAQGIAVGDFNGDGILDVVAVGYGATSQYQVLLGLGDGTYDATPAIPLGNDPVNSDAVAVVAADFNGDGVLDLAIVNELESTVVILQGDVDPLLPGVGTGTFTQQSTITVGSFPNAIALGDFNHDGKTDLALSNFSDGSVSILLGHGDETFADPATVFVGTSPGGVAVGDFNGDGIDDVAVTLGDAGQVAILNGVADNETNFATDFPSDNSSPLTFSVGTTPQGIVAGDFNGDGLTDLATANVSSNDISVLMNDSQNPGNFLTAKNFLVSSPLNSGINPHSIVAADFNHDGVLDLATANGVSNNISVMLGSGDGNFAPPAAQTTPSTTTAPVLADFNGDGVIDSVSIDGSGNVLLRLGRADVVGTFAPAIVVNGGSPAASFAAFKDGGKTLLGIIDRPIQSTAADGLPVGQNSLVQHITLYSFTKAGLPNVVSRQVIGKGTAYDRMLAAKLNGDNRDDLVAVDSSRGAVDMFARAGSGFNVAAPVSIAVGAASDVVAANLDGAGNIDLALANPVAGTLSIILNGLSAIDAVGYRSSAGPTGTQLTGPGEASDSSLVFDGASSVAVGDFNGDHIADAVVAHSGSNTLGLLLGKGNGSFASAIDIAAGSQPIAIQTADFNGDHKLDLAVLNSATHDVSIFLGDGQGNFALQSVSYDAGNSPTSLTLFDVNHDGKLDLVVGNVQGDVTVLLGNGNGTFKPFTRIDRNMALAVGDLDGDGKPDWVVSNHSGDRLVVTHEQQGPGLTQTGSDGITAPEAAQVADLNNDGIMDLVVANGGANGILVYLGLGGGQFAAQPLSFFTGTDPVDVQVADLNHDGNMDVVVTNYGSNDVTILDGTGDSSVLKPHLLLRNVGQGPTGTQLGDFNGDGRMDLLVTGSVSNTVTMFSGAGAMSGPTAGFFNQNTTVFDTGRNPTQTLVGNFNGQMGFVTLNRDSNSLTFYSGFDSAHRRDLSSGGTAPVTAIVGDFNNDGMSDLIVANNGNGVFSLFAGEQAGLSLAGGFFDDALSHPAALALGQFGQGKELQLLALDEGDESVHTFGRENLIGDPNALNSQIASATTSSLSSILGLNSNGLSLAFTFTAALGIAAEGFLSQTSDTVAGEGGGTDVSRSLPGDLFGDLGSAVKSGQRMLESALESVGGAFGLKIDENKVAKTVEDVVSLLFPHLPIQVLPGLIHNFLGSINPKNSPAPFVVDQALENYDANGWFGDIRPGLTEMFGASTTSQARQSAISDMLIAQTDAEGAAPAARPIEYASARQVQIDPQLLAGIKKNGVPMKNRDIAEQSNAQPIRRLNDETKTKTQASSENRPTSALAAVLAAVGVGGWMYRARRQRDESLQKLLRPTNMKTKSLNITKVNP